MVSWNNNIVSNCYNTGTLSGMTQYTGAVVGQNNKTVSNCWYLSGTGPVGAGGNSSAISDFTDGIIAYNLQGEQDTFVWGHTELKSGEYPRLASLTDNLLPVLLMDIKNNYYKTSNSTQYILEGGKLSSLPEVNERLQNAWWWEDEDGRTVTLDTTFTSEQTVTLKWNLHDFEAGDGSAESPYLIKTPYQFGQVGVLVNSDYANYGSKHYALGANIVWNNTSGWESWNASSTGLNTYNPIGTQSYSFNGTFNGQGYAVSGIFINGSQYQGLFGFVGENGTVKNLGVAMSYFRTSTFYLGAIAGANSGIIGHCYNSGSVSGSSINQNIGGITGINSGTLTNSYNAGQISGNTNIGGLAGNNSGTISNCYNTGINTNTTSNGAIAATNTGTITNCYYLENTALAAGGGNIKTQAAFKSGEIAYLLQKGQSSFVWGHTALNGNEYPCLSNFVVDSKPVIKITFSDEYNNDTTEILILTGSSVTLPDIETRPGYSSSWINENEQTVTSETTFDTDGIITAYFSPLNTQYKVVHYKQNISCDGYILFETENLESPTDSSVNAFSKTYTGFLENTQHDSRISSGNVAADGSLILKLYYDRLTYTVTFDASGGNFVIGDEEQIVVFENAAETPVAERNGYEFAGWNSEFDSITSNITVIALWDIKTYTINFSGEDVTEQNINFNIESDIIILPAPEREGYTFMGWYLTEQQDGQAVTQIEQGTTGNITLYAKWEANQVKNFALWEILLLIFILLITAVTLSWFLIRVKKNNNQKQA